MRVLAIDWGEKYIGLAISDPLRIIAQGLDVWEIKDEEDFVNRLKKLIEEYNVSEIVLGYPISLRGHENEKTKKIEYVAERIKTVLNLPIKFVDERFTTMEAERVLLEGDIKRRDRKLLKNKQAAVIILQKYLDSLSLDTKI
ncbi:MAG: Holliday junction resolvase RuvX [Dictyoglomus turgidum]|nr:MAG: Holliday junction resolvase RuvX [Dictyoglomus turgidum]